ncbi:MAG: 30S ribosomal protein S9 [Candidatus Diapherotrites archaeon]
MTAKAKKKEARARAVIRKGTGKIKINKLNLECVEPKYVRLYISEPLELAGPLAKEVDIDVSVKGGGFMGQAVSARAAIAKALLRIHKSSELKQKFLKYDRMLLVDDPRRTEPKKPLGTGARAKKQKSKR